MILTGFGTAVFGAAALYLVKIYQLGKAHHWVRFEQSKNDNVANENTINQMYGLFTLILAFTLTAMVMITLSLFAVGLIPVLTIFSIIVVLDVIAVYCCGYVSLWMMKRDHLIPDVALEEYEYQGKVQFAITLIVALVVGILVQVAPFTRLF